MKATPAALIAHRAEGVTTMARCWRASLVNGTVYGFTAHSADLSIDGVTYSAKTGHKPSAVQTSGSLAVDNLTAHGLLDPAGLHAADMMAGLWDGAKVEIFDVNWADPAMGLDYVHTGHLGQVSLGRTQFEAELVGLTQRYENTLGSLVMPACPYNFGDARCKISLAAWTVSGTIDVVASNRQFSDAARTEAADHFTGGMITFDSGLNTGLSMEVRGFSAGALTLHQAMPYAVQAGDAYTLTAGCMKRWSEDCDLRFANTDNFGGYPHAPSLDRMMSGT